MFNKVLITVILAFSSNLFTLIAHIDKSSLSIKGGEIFSTGDTVKIEWRTSIPHNVPHLIYFSSAPEKPWELIDSVNEVSGTKTLSYQWVVPEMETTNSRIRIFQRFVPKPGETTDDYTLVSGKFTIRSAKTSIFSRLSLRQSKSKIPTKRSYPIDLKGRKIDVSQHNLNRHVHITTGNLYLGPIW